MTQQSSSGSLALSRMPGQMFVQYGHHLEVFRLLRHGFVVQLATVYPQKIALSLYGDVGVSRSIQPGALAHSPSFQ